ncbi:MAG: hypothetical protein WBA84_06830 [Carnobacterium sp.]|uniref:hypothetical protein n=1 Tax=Carnobacterium sp. TaxID=48221 RepID=UPI003C71BEBF
MNKLFKLPMRLQFFAENDGADADGAQSGDDPKTFTQEEVDALLADRLSRHDKKATKVQSSLQTQLDEAAAKLANAGKSEEEQGNAELDALKGNLSAKEEELASTKAELEALKQGVVTDNVSKVIKLAKLSDEEDIEEAIKSVLEEFPMFKQAAEEGKPNFAKNGNPNSNSKSVGAFEAITKKYEK